MLTLGKIKNYLRIDDDITDDDAMLQDLQQTAKIYIQNSTGKQYKSGDKVFEMAILQLVAHWYDNRQQTAAKSGAVYSMPFAVKNLMIHIQNSRHYESLDGGQQ